MVEHLVYTEGVRSSSLLPPNDLQSGFRKKAAFVFGVGKTAYFYTTAIQQGNNAIVRETLGKRLSVNIASWLDFFDCCFRSPKISKSERELIEL
jgi:hypothetical protein